MTITENPSGWKETKLSEVAEKIAMGPFGSNIKVATFVDEGIPVISGQHLKQVRLQDFDYNFITKEHAQSLKNSMVRRGDVIFTHAGNIGQVSFIPNGSFYSEYMISQRQFYLRPNLERIDPVYLTYYFHSRIGQHKLLSASSQVGVPSIARPTTHLKSIEIVLPPLAEQRAIVAVLSSIDNKIELLRNQSENLEAIAQQLFHEWFVENESKESKESKESIAIEEVVEFNPKEKINQKQQHLFFDMKCLSDNSMSISNGIKRVVSSASNFRENDTLMAKITPCLENGKTGFVAELEGNEIARGSTEFIVMRAKEMINPFFVYCLARDNNFRDHAIKSMTGTSGRQRVQVDQLKSYSIPFDLKKINVFGETVKPVFQKIKSNSAQMKALFVLHNYLLPRMMSGELRVRNAVSNQRV